jgi:hypothetical protein
MVDIGVFVGSDHVSGVPKVAKNNKNYTSSELSITTRMNIPLTSETYSLLHSNLFKSFLRYQS